MLDLRILRDRWTEDGARAIFAELVTQCVRTVYPGARSIRPDPGDDGIDTYVGDLDGDLHVWQAKYFCDGVDQAQQAQIRSSWKQCTSSEHFGSVVRWTLCLPIELSIRETKWWQGWRKRESEKHKRHIELWTRTDFVRFWTQPALSSLFAIALQHGVSHPNWDAALSAIRAARPAAMIRRLPSADHLRNAIFVRKLEAAGVRQHRSARTAFYNFELLRSALVLGGSPHEIAELEDLQERVYALWEAEYNARAPDRLGRELVTAVDKLLEFEDDKRLRTTLPAHVLHKKGGLHYWADVCEAGWTESFSGLVFESAEEDM